MDLSKVTYFDFFLLLDLEADDFFAFVAILVSFLCAIKHADFAILRFRFEKIKSNKKRSTQCRKNIFYGFGKKRSGDAAVHRNLSSDQCDVSPQSFFAEVGRRVSFLPQKQPDESRFRAENVPGRNYGARFLSFDLFLTTRTEKTGIPR